MEDEIADMLGDPNTHIYICGLRAMEEGVEAAFTNIAEITRTAMAVAARCHALPRAAIMSRPIDGQG